MLGSRMGRDCAQQSSNVRIVALRGKGETNLSYDTETPNRETYIALWWEDIGFEAETFEADGLNFPTDSFEL